MKEGLTLAVRGQGSVEPNPMVGCVIVRNGRVVGRGYHRKFGGPHAEVYALREAGVKARGATAYVTLEPCCHFGKTPPCVDALIAAGIRRVVAAMRDPNPLVRGKGFRKLRAAGIDVAAGVLENEANVLNAPFTKLQTTGRPYVILKWAQSLDGCLATGTGDSKWISGSESRKRVHEIRARVDGIMVGVNTVLADDPLLTARGVPVKRIATRIVLDTRLQTPLRSNLVKNARKVPTLIFCGMSHSQSRLLKDYSRTGCEVIPVATKEGHVSLAPVLYELGRRHMTNLLVEGGGKILSSFISAKIADEAHIFVNPMLIGGDSRYALALKGIKKVRQAIALRMLSMECMGQDLCYNIAL